MEKSKKVNNTTGSVSGKVVFSQTKGTGYGSCLELKLENEDKEYWWQEQKSIPAFIKVGDRIRGFYSGYSDHQIIVLDAYELLDENDKVLTRTCKRGYEF